MDRWNQNNDKVPKYKYTGLCCEKMERDGENEEEMRENEEIERKWRENTEMERDLLPTFPHFLFISSPSIHFVYHCRKMLNTALLSRMSQQT